MMKNQDIVIEVAEQLFRKYGIKKVTVEEICAEAGISKMTFYRAFSNKSEIAAKVIDVMSERGITDYHQIMNANLPFGERIKNLIELKKRQSEHFSEDFIRDIYGGNDDELKSILEEYREKSVKLFMDDLKKAQDEGWVRKSLKPEFVVVMINAMQEKISDPTFLSLFKNVQEATNEITTAFFYGILAEEKP